MLRWALLLLLLLQGCRGYQLDEKWKPLTRIQECPLVLEARGVTIGETIYVNNYEDWKGTDTISLEAHLAHEQIHSIRQRNLLSWLWNYATDREFMKYEEQIAYYTQIMYLKQHNRQSNVDMLNDYSVFELYENLEGKMFKNKQEFEQWFKEVSQGKWKP